MTQTHDVMLNGAGYMLVPGSYKYKALGADVKPVRAGIDSFETRYMIGAGGPVVVDKDAVRWSSVGMMPVPVGVGDEPGRLILQPVEATTAGAVGGAFSLQARGVIYLGQFYIAQGANLYRVAAGAYAAPSFIGVGAGVITDMAVIDGLLFMACAGVATMSNYAGSGAITNSPAAGAVVIWQYASGIWRSKNNTGLTDTISGSIDGGATWRDFELDSPVRAAIAWHGRATGGGVMLVATQFMLWELSGQWTGSPAVFGGTVSPIYDTAGGGGSDDFSYLVEYQGLVWTWYAGTVHRWDGVRLLPMAGAPRGFVCGMATAGGLLFVSVNDALAGYGLWACDGVRWWQWHAAAAAPYVGLAGTAGVITDVGLFAGVFGSTTLSRWQLPTAALPASALASGKVTVGPLDAGQGDAVKTWNALLVDWSAVLSGSGAAPASPPGGALLLECSVDDGQTFTTAGTVTLGVGARAGLAVQAISPPLEAQRLMVRATLTPTSSYPAYQICGVHASGWRIGDTPHTETWQFDVHVSDRMITRAGGVDARSGETQIAALRALAQSGAPVTFQDIDFDLSARSVTARVIGFEESSRKGDGTHFLESSVRLTLAAVA